MKVSYKRMLWHCSGPSSPVDWLLLADPTFVTRLAAHAITRFLPLWSIPSAVVPATPSCFALLSPLPHLCPV